VTTDRLAPATTVSRLVDDLARTLTAGGVAEPISEAREIVAALYDVPRFWPLLNGGVGVDAPTTARAIHAAEKRAHGAPLAYAVGRASFRHLTLDVDERVLIPRPETEQLVELVLEEMAGTAGGVAIDVGTGSGATHVHRLELVLQLGLLILLADDESRGQMCDAHRGVGRVHTLSARTRRAEDVDAEILVFDLDVDLLGLGKHRDGGG
jgi:hypothetical protein